MPGTRRKAGTSLCAPTKKSKKDSIGSISSLQKTEVTSTHMLHHKLEGMPGAEAFYIPQVIDSGSAKDWYDKLESLDTWYHPSLKVHGKAVTQSRSIAAYATSEAITVKYSGHQVALHYEYPEVLTKIQAVVEEIVGVTFNHVMLNRYESGDEYIGKHRDTKENKVIASLSLGAERTFIFTPNKNCPGNPTRKSFTLQNGSLLIMRGDTQKNWKHEIPKEPKISEGRISLTFRQLETR